MTNHKCTFYYDERDTIYVCKCGEVKDEVDHLKIAKIYIDEFLDGKRSWYLNDAIRRIQDALAVIEPK